jgi:hypothetical protein
VKEDPIRPQVRREVMIIPHHLPPVEVLQEVLHQVDITADLLRHPEVEAVHHHLVVEVVPQVEAVEDANLLIFSF